MPVFPRRDGSTPERRASADPALSRVIAAIFRLMAAGSGPRRGSRFSACPVGMDERQIEPRSRCTWRGRWASAAVIAAAAVPSYNGSTAITSGASPTTAADRRRSNGRRSWRSTTVTSRLVAGLRACGSSNGPNTHDRGARPAPEHLEPAGRDVERPVVLDAARAQVREVGRSRTCRAAARRARRRARHQHLAPRDREHRLHVAGGVVRAALGARSRTDAPTLDEACRRGPGSRSRASAARTVAPPGTARSCARSGGTLHREAGRRRRPASAP